MTKRTDRVLTEYAQPVADKLAKRYGQQRTVLSAGVIALYMSTSADRDRAFAIANGEEPMPDISLDTAEQELRQKILQIVKEAQAIPEEKQHEKKAKSVKSA